MTHGELGCVPAFSSVITLKQKELCFFLIESLFSREKRAWVHLVLAIGQNDECDGVTAVRGGIVA